MVLGNKATKISTVFIWIGRFYIAKQLVHSKIPYQLSTIPVCEFFQKSVLKIDSIVHVKEDRNKP